MYREKGERHHLPHFHAEYQGEEAAITFDGELLEGTLPKKKMHLVTAWAHIHQDDLLANWKLLVEGREIFKIDPLR